MGRDCEFNSVPGYLRKTDDRHGRVVRQNFREACAWRTRANSEKKKGHPVNYKASARCANGHIFELGTCKVEVKKLFGGTKLCGSKGFEQDYAAGTIRCSGCHTVFKTIACPECGDQVPIKSFEKKG